MASKAGRPTLMRMAPRVIHTAQALVDAVLSVPDLPQRGGNVMASAYARYAGGAVNILIAAARSGAECVHAGAHGTGPNGDLVRAALAAEGVALSAPPIPDLDTGVCVVLLEPSAERTFVTTQLAERRITPESLQMSEPVAGDLVCVSGYSLFGETSDPLRQWLAGLPTGVEVVLDPGDAIADLDPGVRDEVIARTGVWTSNASEARALVGPIEDLLALAQGVRNRLAPDAVAVVRDGPKGCAVATVGGVSAVPGYPQEAVDTNGAGDTHTGVLVAARAAGLDWIEACRRANAAGALKVTRRGPASAPTSAEIDDFLASHH